MPDEGAQPPVQQAPPEAATAPGQQAPPTFNPDDYVSKDRFTGAIQKIQTLTTEADGFRSQLAEKTSEIEQLQRQLAEKDAGHTALLGQRETQIGELTTQTQTLQKQLKAKEVDLLKVQVAKEIGHPELITILDTIPGVEDPDALKTIMTNIAGFAETQVKQREAELLSGETPAVTSVQNAQDQFPAAGDNQAWEKHLASLDPYSPEYDKALRAWGEQLQQPQK